MPQRRTYLRQAQIANTAVCLAVSSGSARMAGRRARDPDAAILDPEAAHDPRVGDAGVGSDAEQADVEPVASVGLDERSGHGDLLSVSPAPNAGSESLEGERFVGVRRPGSPRCAVPLDLRAPLQPGELDVWPLPAGSQDELPVSLLDSAPQRDLDAPQDVAPADDAPELGVPSIQCRHVV